jgi:methionyl-tRNA formyltransferase
MNASPKPTRVIFFGTPEFAVPCLRAVADIAEVVLVVTQPDRPAGRGMKLHPPPVKVLAQELGLRVEQPTKVRTPEFAASLAACEADVALVVAYGRILPTGVLRAPRLGCVNVHASLLPKLRGAAPIQWSIVRGEHETGVCLMQMDEGLDTGPVLARASVPIGADENAAELAARLSRLGADVVKRELPRFLMGELAPVAQSDAQATLAPLLRKEDGAIDWSQSAQRVHDLVRGLSPWPGAFSWLANERIKVHRTQVRAMDVREHASEHGSGHAGGNIDVSPGTCLGADATGLHVACGDGVLSIIELQLDGKAKVSAAAFAAGHRLPTGSRFANSPS